MIDDTLQASARNSPLGEIKELDQDHEAPNEKLSKWNGVGGRRSSTAVSKALETGKSELHYRDDSCLDLLVSPTSAT